MVFFMYICIKLEISMEMTIDKFIKELQNISEDKRKLPLVMFAPNGLQFEPSIKMLFDGSGNPLVDKLEKMVITY